MGGRGDLNKVTEIGVELGVLNCKQHRAEIASNFFHNDLIKLSRSDRARAPSGRLVSLKTVAALRSKSADQRLLLVSKFCSVLVADRFADSLSARFTRRQRLYPALTSSHRAKQTSLSSPRPFLFTLHSFDRICVIKSTYFNAFRVDFFCL